MISILTYPSNSGTEWIDPDYIGTNTTGYKGRIKSLRDGNYKDITKWIVGTGTVDKIMETTSMFKYYLKSKSYSGNISIYDIWYRPMILGQVNGSGVITGMERITNGNEQFRQRTGASSYTGSARVVAGKYWKPGVDGALTPTSDASITITTDSDGYITGASGTGGSGYDDNGTGYVLFEIEQDAADTYPPTPTALEAADTWDTDDGWTNGSEDTLKKWPSTVAPAAAEITYLQPTAITRSQSGIKYAKSSGYTKWSVELEYPPMTANQFKEYAAIAQAARGQTTPFLLELVQDGKNILFKNLNSSNSANKLKLKDNVSAGDLVILLEGLAVGDTLSTGDTIAGEDGNCNGNINTIISTANANVFGEAKVRLAYPIKTAQDTGDSWTTSPDNIVVTLNENEFLYTTGLDNLYYLTVVFELDEWKL